MTAIALPLALTALACAASLSSGASPAASPFDERLIVQSHRGAGNLAPENTMEAFELAWSIGSVPEADVRATRDGVVVAFHDDNLKRVAPEAPAEIQGKSVNELYWSTVRSLDVGVYKGEQFRGQRIPQISRVLDAMTGHPDRWLYLDIKKVPLEELARMVRRRGVAQQVILASTRYEEIRMWKKLLPDSQTLHWIADKQEKMAQRLKELEKADFADITQLQLHIRVGDLSSPEPFAPTSAFVKEAGKTIRSRGILFQALVIGSDRAEAYEKLMDLGVESFASDGPLVTLQVMRSRAKAR